MWLIATFPSKKYNIEKFPEVKRHLLSFGINRLEQSGKKYVINGQIINARKKTNNKWFETQDNIGYWEDFSKQKIIYSEIVRNPQFYYDQKGTFFVEATAFFMTGIHLDYLTALLNSRVFSYIFKTFYAGGGLGSEGYRYKKAFLINMPIPKYKASPIQKQIINLCNTRSLRNHVEIDNEIEKSIINLIGLSRDEANIINEEIN